MRGFPAPIVFLFFLYAYAAASPGVAQDRSTSPGLSEVQVRVTNGKGAAIAGATVLVLNGNLRRYATSSADGLVQMNLPPGEYTFEISKQGFRGEKHSWTISSGHQLSFTAVLHPPKKEIIDVQ